MTPSARLAAAIDILRDIEGRRRPAADVLKEWGLGHRYAGSKDRAGIASLVYDALRVKASAAYIMQDNTARAITLGMLKLLKKLDAEAISALFTGERYAPDALTDQECERLGCGTLEGAPDHVIGDCPEWAAPLLRQSFGHDFEAELLGLKTRAPLDIRINTLKTNRTDMKAALAHWEPLETPYAHHGLRFPLFEDGRGPSLQSEPEFLHGGFEIQDEGSQIAALLSDVRPGENVIDLCAGAGGKTLALAALMQDQGHLIATDDDLRRLAPIHERLKRAGVTCVEVRTPRGRLDPLLDIQGLADCVVVDAPCTGSGTWRRNPDAKWRLRPGSLEARIKEQAIVLDRAAHLVRSGGRLLYITCSVLEAENDGAVSAFLSRHEGMKIADISSRFKEFSLKPRQTQHGYMMTPYTTGTDGFYVCAMNKL
jgi:16S rRNA (cytosine967-C5)-methyltransferase